jgi:hypothetical protein
MVFVLTFIHSSHSSYPSSAGKHKLILPHDMGNVGEFYQLQLQLSQHRSDACVDIHQQPIPIHDMGTVAFLELFDTGRPNIDRYILRHHATSYSHHH